MKKLLFVLLVLLVLGVGGWSYLNESLPPGKSGPVAEELADKMLKALNKPGYDSLSYLSWTFRGRAQYHWWKSEKRVEVIWDDFIVMLDLETLKGSGTKSGNELSDDELNEALAKAWSMFANDSFWLVAPFKVRDPGTIRELVMYNGSEALKVTYSSGGVTPGDSYLWILDKDFRPVSWKIWASILPLEGMEFSWENWKIYRGVPFSDFHSGVADIVLEIHEIR